MKFSHEKLSSKELWRERREGDPQNHAQARAELLRRFSASQREIPPNREPIRLADFPNAKIIS
jgi:hypothetical protein